MKLTKWFPPEIKPVHPGVYKTVLHQGKDSLKGYSRWTGTGAGWMDTEPTIEKAAKTNAFGMDEKTWRGLAEKPK